jgi:hypothetical protein
MGVDATLHLYPWEWDRDTYCTWGWMGPQGQSGFNPWTIQPVVVSYSADSQHRNYETKVYSCNLKRDWVLRFRSYPEILCGNCSVFEQLWLPHILLRSWSRFQLVCGCVFARSMVQKSKIMCLCVGMCTRFYTHRCTHGHSHWFHNVRNEFWFCMLFLSCFVIQWFKDQFQFFAQRQAILMFSVVFLIPHGLTLWCRIFFF